MKKLDLIHIFSPKTTMSLGKIEMKAHITFWLQPRVTSPASQVWAPIELNLMAIHFSLNYYLF